MRRTTVLLGLLCALACTDDRPEKLRAEIAELEEQRMPTDVYERMVAEAAESERALVAFEAELEIEAAQLDELRGEATRLDAALAAEVRRNEEIREAIVASQQALRRAAARRVQLQTEIVRHQARARVVADQANVLARELRPDDPDWALTLRLASLREFLGQVEERHPHDADLAALSATELPSDPSAATRVGADVAARVRDHLREVYGLETAHADSDADPPAGDAPPRS